MAKIGFVGFGEVNTPVDVIIKRCGIAAEELEKEGLELVKVFPVADDYEEVQVNNAIAELKKESFEALVLCVAGWIPAHAVIKISEHFRHLPVVLWGLCGWVEGDKLVTTADQAGTSGLRATLEDMGYTFKYVYNTVGLPSRAPKVASYCKAAIAAKNMRHARAGMAGYRDMNLYGTLYDGCSLKQVIGPEIETFEMLEMQQRYEKLDPNAVTDVVENRIKKWHFVSPAQEEGMRMAAGYYLAVKAIAEERGFKSISIKDVDGMKKLVGFPPAPIFMLLQEDGYLTVPENDSMGCVTLMLMQELTGQTPFYLEFYEFFEKTVLAGVPDYVPSQVVDGEVTVMPAAFGELNEGILNISKVKPGMVTMCRLLYKGGKYVMHMVYGKGIAPRKWNEYGWADPAPQLPSLEIELPDVDNFAQSVGCQHYIITYGDNRAIIRDFCAIRGISVVES
ncbi:MAG: hypothetical protein IKC04_03520 [Oscillospiraceae bacterium]|nr:hypothetical protein [Oscillospiraceae bacterium]